MVLSLSASVLIGACSRGPDVVNAANGVNNGTGQSGTVAPSASDSASTKAITDLATTVHLNGFEIELGSVHADQSKKRVLIDTVVRNPTKSDGTGFGDVLLLSANDQRSTGGWSDNSSIAGGQQRPQQLYVTMDPSKLDLATSTLVLGSAKKQQVRVPLGDPRTAVTLAPTAVESPVPPVKIGDVTITPKTVEARFDAKHNEVDADKAYVVISGSAESADRSHGWDKSKVKITGPDGKTTAPDEITPLGLSANTPTDEFVLRFVVDAPVRGTYTVDFGEQKFGAASKAVTTEPLTLTFPAR